MHARGGEHNCHKSNLVLLRQKKHSKFSSKFDLVPFRVWDEGHNGYSEPKLLCRNVLPLKKANYHDHMDDQNKDIKKDFNEENGSPISPALPPSGSANAEGSTSQYPTREHHIYQW